MKKIPASIQKTSSDSMRKSIGVCHQCLQKKDSGQSFLRTASTPRVRAVLPQAKRNHQNHKLYLGMDVRVVYSSSHRC